MSSRCCMTAQVLHLQGVRAPSRFSVIPAAFEKLKAPACLKAAWTSAAPCIARSGIHTHTCSLLSFSSALIHLFACP